MMRFELWAIKKRLSFMNIESKEVKELLSRIGEKKNQLDNLRPLPKDLLKNLDEWFCVELAYSSNAIEGNTITKSETALILEKGLTVSGKSLKEHLEIKNYAFALEYLKELTTKTKKDIDLKIIKQIHFLILKGIDDTSAGAWRKVEIKLLGSDVKLPDPIKVPELMNEFIFWLHNIQDYPEIITFDAHYKFVRIHPFIDGNGRVARLLMNLLLMQKGYPPVIVNPKNRLLYIDSMQKIDSTGDWKDYYLLMLQFLEKSFDIYLDAAQKSLG